MKKRREWDILTIESRRKSRNKANLLLFVVGIASGLLIALINNKSMKLFTNNNEASASSDSSLVIEHRACMDYIDDTTYGKQYIFVYIMKDKDTGKKYLTTVAIGDKCIDVDSIEYIEGETKLPEKSILDN